MFKKNHDKSNLSGKCLIKTGLEGDVLPCRNVVIILTDEAEHEIARTLTDASGDFIFRSIMGRKYGLKVESERYILSLGGEDKKEYGDQLTIFLEPSSKGRLPAGK